MQGNREGEPVTSEGMTSRCDACGRIGVAYRLSVTNLQRPFAPHHRHYCASCWDTLRGRFDDEPQGASTTVDELGAPTNAAKSGLKMVDVQDDTGWKAGAMRRTARE
jgi:hypothetical protein